MKKLIFTALVAVVAIGGAFASKTVFPAYAKVNGGPCNPANAPEDCTASSGTICTVISGPNSTTYYPTSSCAIPLRRL